MRKFKSIEELHQYAKAKTLGTVEGNSPKNEPKNLFKVIVPLEEKHNHAYPLWIPSMVCEIDYNGDMKCIMINGDMGNYLFVDTKTRTANETEIDKYFENLKRILKYGKFDLKHFLI